MEMECIYWNGTVLSVCFFYPCTAPQRQHEQRSYQQQ